MTEVMRVYVNGRPLEVSQGSTVSDAVRAYDRGMAGRLAAGGAVVTDGVGRPIGPTEPVVLGAILRVIEKAGLAREDGNGAHEGTD